MKAPLLIQIGAILIGGLLLSQMLEGAGLGRLLPLLVILLWAVVIGGLMHAQGWPWFPAIGTLVGRTPPLRNALDLLVGGAAPRPAPSGRAAAAGPAAVAQAAQPRTEPVKLDPAALGRAIREGVSSSLLGQQEAAAALSAIAARALDPKAGAAGPRIVVVAGGPGSGRSTLLDIVARGTRAAGAPTILLRLGDMAEAAGLAAAAVVLVDDMDRQPEPVVEAVAALLRRREATRLVILAFRDNLPVPEPDRQPVPEREQLDRMLAPLGSITHASLAGVIVPSVPDAASMVREATARLVGRCREHGMQLAQDASKSAIGLMIMLPHRHGGNAVHPGLWIRHLEALCDRELPALERAGAQTVALAVSDNRNNVLFRKAG